MRSQHFLPYGCQSIDAIDVAAVTSALQSASITQGPLVEVFERGLCRYLEAEHAVVCNSGTAALHLAYAAIGLGPGDNIVTSPITFAATANAARYLGADVLFADVDLGSGNLDPVAVAKCINPRTKAIVAVHLAGTPADMAALRHLADQHGVILVEDAAHALGARWRGQAIGSSLADVSTFSFHPVKHLTTGEGGALTTPNTDIAIAARRLREHGIVRPRDQHTQPWFYEMVDLGFNYRLSEIACALGISQLAKQGAWLDRRQQIAEMYREKIVQRFGTTVTPQQVSSDSRSAYHLFSVAIDYEECATSRAQVMRDLRNDGIGTQVHYIPVDTHPYYRNLYGPPPPNRAADLYYRRTLSLPMFPDLRELDVDSVLDSLSRSLHTHLATTKRAG